MALRPRTERLELDGVDKIVFLTGAGISAASGLGTYRGPGGLWEQAGAREMAEARTLEERPLDVWRFFGELRQKAMQASPNAAHRAITHLQQRSDGEKEIFVITQNVDGLHQRTGTRNVIELHGAIYRSRCSSQRCRGKAFADQAAYTAVAPSCDLCGAPLRPDIVLFEEPIPVDAERQAKEALRDCQLFIAVGTSGTVSPASAFARSADYEGAQTLIVNLEPMAPPNPYYHREVLGPAEELLPGLLGLEPSASLTRQ